VLSIVEEIIELLNEGNDQRTAASKLDALLSFLGTIFRNKDKHLQVRVELQLWIESYRTLIQHCENQGGQELSGAHSGKL
jgi:hypothetical protein